MPSCVPPMLRLARVPMPKTKASTTTTSLHDRRLASRWEDPEFRAEFERATREITAIDALVNQLDGLREAQGLTKAELAREIDKNPASVRRLFTAPSNPELRTIVAMANALDADVVIVPRSRRSPTAA
jgi:DNA-binding XRE family transcriptional regulator